MTASFQSLPEELVYYIIGLDTDKSTLAILTRVSKDFNRFAAPRLYHTLEFKNGSIDMGNKWLLPITYHLFRKPQLASYVRELSMRTVFATEEMGVFGDNHTDDKFTKWNWPEQPDLDDVLRGAAKKLYLTEDEENEKFDVLKKGYNEDAILAVLLPLLPNLQRLDFPWTNGTKHIQGMLERYREKMPPFDEWRPFGQLREVMVCGYMGDEPTEPNFFYECLGIPSVTLINGIWLGNSDQDEVDKQLASLEDRSSGVESIELRSSHLYEDDFAKLMCVCRALKSFIYQTGLSACFYSFTTTTIQRGLDRHTDTLETLCLDHCVLPSFGVDDIIEPMTFSSFTALKDIKLAPPFIFGKDGVHFTPTGDPAALQRTRSRLIECLPANVEKLRLCRAKDLFTGDRVHPALQELVQRRSESFPRLAKVEISGEFDGFPSRVERLREFCELADASGIETRVFNEPGLEKRTEDKKWGIDEDQEWATSELNIHDVKTPFSVRVGERLQQE